jgi:mercuric ion transport protein
MTQRKGMAAMLPVFAVVAVPKCPLCLLALGGGIAASSASSAGWMTTYRAWLAPVTVVALLLTLGTLVFRARVRRGYGPAVLALVAAVLLYIGKFHLGEQVAVYSGMSLLLAATVWNAWPRREAPCLQCSSQANP